jgi:DNA-binding Xre family transcriptional regulator
MKDATSRLAEIVRERKLSPKMLSVKTGVPYMALYYSFFSDKRNRELRADELLKVCKELHIDPIELI